MLRMYNATQKQHPIVKIVELILRIIIIIYQKETLKKKPISENRYFSHSFCNNLNLFIAERLSVW